MPITPIFTGRVSDAGFLSLTEAERDRRREYFQELAGKDVDVTVKVHRSQRSLKQNAWHWGIAVPMIAEELGYDRHEHDLVHYALVDKCFGTTFNERLGQAVPNVRSSALSTVQFSELMEWEVRFAAETLGIVIPLPDEAEVMA